MYSVAATVRHGEGQMPSATVSIKSRTARLRAQMSLQLLHDSRTTGNVKMILEWALESVANPNDNYQYV